MTYKMIFFVILFMVGGLQAGESARVEKVKEKLAPFGWFLKYEIQHADPSFVVAELLNQSDANIDAVIALLHKLMEAISNSSVDPYFIHQHSMRSWETAYKNVLAVLNEDPMLIARVPLLRKAFDDIKGTQDAITKMQGWHMYIKAAAGAERAKKELEQFKNIPFDEKLVDQIGLLSAQDKKDVYRDLKFVNDNLEKIKNFSATREEIEALNAFIDKAKANYAYIHELEKLYGTVLKDVITEVQNKQKDNIVSYILNSSDLPSSIKDTIRAKYKVRLEVMFRQSNDSKKIIDLLYAMAAARSQGERDGIIKDAMSSNTINLMSLETLLDIFQNYPPGS